MVTNHTRRRCPGHTATRRSGADTIKKRATPAAGAIHMKSVPALMSCPRANRLIPSAAASASPASNPNHSASLRMADFDSITIGADGLRSVGGSLHEAILAEQQLQNLPAGSEYPHLTLAADARGLVAPDFADPHAGNLREANRTLERPAQSRGVPRNPIERLFAVAAVADQHVRVLGAEQLVGHEGEHPVADRRHEVIVIALRATLVARDDDEVVAIADLFQ